MPPHDISAATTRVSVRDLKLLADVGINPDEIGRRQPLDVSVTLTLSGEVGRGIEQTVDYRLIVSAIETVAAKHIPLIETFAEQVATRCLSWQRVTSAVVRVEKPFALPRGTASVEVSIHST